MMKERAKAQLQLEEEPASQKISHTSNNLLDNSEGHMSNDNNGSMMSGTPCSI